MRVLHKKPIPTTDVECEHCSSRLRIEKKEIFVRGKIGGVDHMWKCQVCEHENPIILSKVDWKRMVG